MLASPPCHDDLPGSKCESPYTLKWERMVAVAFTRCHRTTAENGGLEGEIKIEVLQRLP